MEELIKQVINSECEEYGRASVKFGAANNSDHESFAVLREEVDEAMDRVEDVDGLTDVFFMMVKANEENDRKIELLKTIQHCAEEGAAELIQAAAMARKAIVTIERRTQKG